MSNNRRSRYKYVGTRNACWPTHKSFKSLLAVLMLIAIALPTDASQKNLNVPCDYRASINITDGFRDSDDNIIFENLTYSKNDYGTYDYELVSGNKRRPVALHLRGCVCRVKKCVQLCCARDEIYANDTCNRGEVSYDLQIALMDKGNTTVDLFQEFEYLVGKPCNLFTPLEPEEYPNEDAWGMLSNGSVLKVNGEMLDKSEYCLIPSIEDGNSTVQVMVCFDVLEPTLKAQIQPIGMIISVPFLVITFLVYAVLPELRNVHGKSLMCYLLGLAVGYSVLSWIQLNNHHHVEPVLCRCLGYTIYIFFLSAFFWLSVICFDLWWNLRGTKSISKHVKHKRFLMYSTYAWGSSLFLGGICYLMDNTSILSTEMQPGIGYKQEGCFLQKKKMSQFLYFYLPIMIITVFDLTFFVLTALKIRKVQVEMARITAKEDSRRHRTQLDKEKDKFGLFLRLFIVMGVTWSMEVISWVIDYKGMRMEFYLTDIFNTIQGIIIFVLFVMKPKVKKLLLKRWRIWRGISPVQREASSSGTTRSTNITMISQMPSVMICNRN